MKSLRPQRDVAFYILTKTNLADELKSDYPKGKDNLSGGLSEVFQKGESAGGYEKLPKKVRIFSPWCYCTVVVRSALGEVYPSYLNSETDREVCLPSRVNGIHNGYDRKV